MGIFVSTAQRLDLVRTRRFDKSAGQPNWTQRSCARRVSAMEGANQSRQNAHLVRAFFVSTAQRLCRIHTLYSIPETWFTLFNPPLVLIKGTSRPCRKRYNPGPMPRPVWPNTSRKTLFSLAIMSPQATRPVKYRTTHVRTDQP